MKGVDYMLIVITVYLMIGGIIVCWLNRTLSDIVKDETLTVKTVYYVCMIVIAPILFVYGIAKGAYLELRKSKLES